MLLAQFIDLDHIPRDNKPYSLTQLFKAEATHTATHLQRGIFHNPKFVTAIFYLSTVTTGLFIGVICHFYLDELLWTSKSLL